MRGEKSGLVDNVGFNLTVFCNKVAISVCGNRGIESCRDTIGGQARLARILFCGHSRFTAKHIGVGITDGCHIEASWIGL